MTRNKYDIEMNLIRQEDISILMIEKQNRIVFVNAEYINDLRPSFH